MRGGVRAVAGRRLDPNSASRLPLKIASYESRFQKSEVQSAGVGVYGSAKGASEVAPIVAASWVKPG